MADHAAAEAEWAAEVRGYHPALANRAFDRVPALAARLRTARDVLSGALESLQAVPSLVAKAHEVVMILTREELATTRSGELVVLSLQQAHDHVHNWLTGIRDVRWHVGRVLVDRWLLTPAQEAKRSAEAKHAAPPAQAPTPVEKEWTPESLRQDRSAEYRQPFTGIGLGDDDVLNTQLTGLGSPSPSRVTRSSRSSAKHGRTCKAPR